VIVVSADDMVSVSADPGDDVVWRGAVVHQVAQDQHEIGALLTPTEVLLDRQQGVDVPVNVGEEERLDQSRSLTAARSEAYSGTRRTAMRFAANRPLRG
jgi:hypothetical protein